MEKRGKKLRIVLETMQWFILLFAFFSCLIVCPKVKQHLKDEQTQRLYQQIHSDKEIDRLNRENMMLVDSLENVRKDTVYLVRFKTIKQPVYIDSCMIGKPVKK